MKRFLKIFLAFLLLFSTVFMNKTILAEDEDPQDGGSVETVTEEDGEEEDIPGLVEEEDGDPDAEDVPEEDEDLPEAEAEASKPSYPYAVLQADGDLVFTRSYDKLECSYHSGAVIEGTLTDIKGRKYTGTIFGEVEETEAVPGWANSGLVKKVYAKEKIKPRNMANWFYSCSGLESFDAKNFDTSECTDMSWMFAYCNHIADLDVHLFDTSAVTGRGFDCMFADMTSLKTLNVSGFDTSNATSLSWMFDWDQRLSSLDLSSFDTSNVTEMTAMLRECSDLKEVRLGKKWTKWIGESNAGLPKALWENEAKDLLKTADELLEDYPSHASEWDGTWKIRRSYAVLQDDGDFVFVRSEKKYSNCSYGTVESLSGNSYTGTIFSDVEKTSENYPGPDWYSDYRNDIKKVYAVDEIKPLCTAYWFYECYHLESFDGTNFNTSRTEDMGAMFDQCVNLTDIDVTSFDTSNVESMHSMFCGCENLKTLDLSSFDTSNVKEMTYLFYDCKMLESVDLSSFDTSNVEDMYCMFSGCESLQSLDVSHFNTQKLGTDTSYAMSYMFNGCSSLKELDLSSFDTSHVREMEDLFVYCTSLEKLDVSGFDTSGVTSMSGMFKNCDALNSVTFGSGWTLWIDDAKLPAGYWSNGVEYLDETDLYNLNPDHIEGTWVRTDKGGYGDITDTQDRAMFDVYQYEGLWMSYLPDRWYTGEAWTPSFRVYDHKTLLKEGTDYTVKYLNNVNAGTASIVVTGKGNYQGTLTGTFGIMPASMSDYDVRVVLDKDCFAYTGKVRKPNVTVYFKDSKLKAGKDYKVEYPDSALPGFYDVSIIGIDGGNFEGILTNVPETRYRVLEEGKIPVNTLSITGIKDMPYDNGHPVYQTNLVVKDTKNGKKLTEMVDYFLDYNYSNYEVGTATLTICGNDTTYFGSVTRTFKIKGTPISKAKIGGVDPSYEWTGSPVEPFPVVTYNDTYLSPGYDFTISYLNNIEVGTATVVVTGQGGYTGTLKKTFKIKGEAFGSKTIGVSGFEASMSYSGLPLEQSSASLFVKETDHPLIEGSDYSVSYKNNVNAGTATAAFRGKGRYSGSFSKTFKITKAKIDEGSVVLNPSYVYAKGGVKPDPTVTVNGLTLKLNKDYTLTYKNNNKAGSASLTVKGKGNYQGSKSASFIVRKGNAAGIVMSAADKVYSAKPAAMKTAVSLSDRNGKKLVAGTDYDKKIVYTYAATGEPVQSSDIIDADTLIKASVTLKGNYSGTVSKVFRIIRADISKATVSIPTQYYTGTHIVPEKGEIKVKLNKTVLDPEDFEIVSLKNNVAKGTATITIRGVGNYGGVKTGKFSIVKRSLGIVVRYRGNGGTGTMKDQMIFLPSTGLKANAFKNPGKTFKGWSLSATGEKKYGDKALIWDDPYLPGAVVTLYALWE